MLPVSRRAAVGRPCNAQARVNKRGVPVPRRLGRVGRRAADEWAKSYASHPPLSLEDAAVKLLQALIHFSQHTLYAGAEQSAVRRNRDQRATFV